ncbi:MAG: carbohydrate kinase family protein [Patescibacteria group bacterium]
MNNLDLLSVGDASIDVFMTPTESETLCQINTKECYIAFSYGEKIPVRNLEFSVGGNAANNAVGTSRLGVKTGIVLTLGDDSIGNMIVEKLKAEGVNMTFVIQQPAASSNYSTIINYSGERTIFTYHAPRSYEFPVALPATPWVYLTSMGESYRPFYNHFVEWLKKNPAIKLAFNPGSWQLKAGYGGIADVLSLSYLIFVNREEAEELTGLKESAGKEKELLMALSKLGPKVCVITDGDNGSYIYDAGVTNGARFVRAEILPVDAYERTGAGDAFGSGCLTALIKGKSLEEALVWGTVNSASVIGYVGPQKGLIKESEMQEWIDRYKSSGVKVGEF